MLLLSCLVLSCLNSLAYMCYLVLSCRGSCLILFRLVVSFLVLSYRISCLALPYFILSCPIPFLVLSCLMLLYCPVVSCRVRVETFLSGLRRPLGDARRNTLKEAFAGLNPDGNNGGDKVCAAQEHSVAECCRAMCLTSSHPAMLRAYCCCWHKHDEDTTKHREMLPLPLLRHPRRVWMRCSGVSMPKRPEGLSRAATPSRPSKSWTRYAPGWRSEVHEGPEWSLSQTLSGITR